MGATELADEADPERVLSPIGSAGAIELELSRLDRSYAHLRVRSADTRRARLVMSLSQDGQRHPVVVVAREGNRFALIDGYRRVDALEQLARDTVMALVLGLEEPAALAYCHRMATVGRRSALEEGWLVAEMLEQSQSLGEIGALLDRSVSWVSRRLALARALPPKATDAVRIGVVPAHGAMRSLVPLARANKTQCERLCERLGDARFSTRQLGALYAAWRAGDREQRERITDAPRLFLDAQRALAPAVVPGAAGALVRDLDAARAALLRAGDGAVCAWNAEPTSLSSAPVERAFTRCTDAYEALVQRMEESHAE